ncbi:hypothetical protein AB0395_21950 [Streptosporangium sp. NPDC051023]
MTNEGIVCTPGSTVSISGCAVGTNASITVVNNEVTEITSDDE